MEYLIFQIALAIISITVFCINIYRTTLWSIPYEYQVGDEISVLVDLYDSGKERWIRESTTAELLGISPDRKTVIIEYNNGRIYNFVEEVKCHNVLYNYSHNKRTVNEKIELLKNKKDIWNEI